jgi:CubicO group peptidase (beta-lactamase class C family)
LPVGAAPAETAWPVPDWQTASPESQNMLPTGVDHVRDWLKAHGSKTGMLLRHGRIVGEWYFEDAKPDSRFLVYSTTKSFSSTAAGLAIAEGKFKLDTKIGAVLVGVDLEEKRNITVRDLLSMTSGVHNNPQINTREDLFHYALIDAPLDHQPGTFWDYNNTGLAILSPVIARAARQQIDELLNEKLFKPIGIRQADWTWERRNSLTIPYSGLEITARGLARYGLLFLNHGKWQDRQLVPAGWVAEATGPSQKMNKSYGYLWWNNTDGKWRGVPSDAFASLGRFDNSMLIVPSLDLIVLRQVGDDTGHDRKIDIGELWRLAVESVQAEPPK